jgi:hypothetical protein
MEPLHTRSTPAFSGGRYGRDDRSTPMPSPVADATTFPAGSVMKNARSSGYPFVRDAR